jgi:hypothetical protein
MLKIHWFNPSFFPHVLAKVYWFNLRIHGIRGFCSTNMTRPGKHTREALENGDLVRDFPIKNGD